MTENNNKITFIATGGTIDSKFHAASEKKIIKEDSGIPDYLRDVIHPHFEGEFKKLIMIDSLDMNDQDREIIVEEIKKTKNNKIIITHGTDTMVETAQFIQNNLPNLNKVIILVGSMIPLDGFYQSDAPFNLGYAIAQTQIKEDGIYICMNAQCFRPNIVFKNKTIGRFEFEEDQ